MKIFNHNVTRRDLVPPIMLKILGKEKQQTLKYFYHDMLRSYSQYNEDLIIDAIFQCKESGFYVDIGANHPDRLSNTKRFYDRGWRGINIEPNPHLYQCIRENRTGDINLNVGIGDENRAMPFYVMSVDTISSFSKESALQSGKIYHAEVKEVINVPVLPLKDVFNQYLTKQIDFLSVDTEGYDLKVLMSNDWDIYRPTLILVESGEAGQAIVHYLADQGYDWVFDNFTNAIYLEKHYCLPQREPR